MVAETRATREQAPVEDLDIADFVRLYQVAGGG